MNNNYDPIFDEPTIELPQAALDFQMMLDDRVRNLTKDMYVRETCDSIYVVTALFPHFKKRTGS